MLRAISKATSPEEKEEAVIKLRTLVEFPRVLYGKYFIDEVEALLEEWRERYENATVCNRDLKKDFRFVKGVIFGLNLALKIPVAASQALGFFTGGSNRREQNERVSQNSESDTSTQLGG